MVQWLIDLLVQFPDDGNWQKRRRQIILARWPEPMVRGAEQDQRNGKSESLGRYDSEVAAIKRAIPNPSPNPTTKEEIDGEARKRILAAYPEWKQANMTARALELMAKGQVNWTDAEQADIHNITAAWGWIKAVRDASNAIVARTAVDPYLDPTTAPEWP